MKDLFKGDILIMIITTLLLSSIGIIFIISTGQLENNHNTNLYIRQLIWIVIGICAVICILMVDYYYFVETSLIYYLAGIGLLILTVLIGKEIKGAKSWLGIGGLGIQSSELMKLCYILFYAKFLGNLSKDEKEIKTFLTSLAILAPPVILIMMQPDFGTTVVFFSIFTVMSLIGFQHISILITLLLTGFFTVISIMSYTYYKFYHVIINGDGHPILDVIFDPNTFFAISIILLLYALITFFIELIQPISWINKFTRISLVLGLSFFITGVAGNILKPYQWNRLVVFINPEFDKLGAGYNSVQSQIAIGSGGISGQGLFKGTQNLRGFLPEKHTDFIFSILAEETGFIGSFLVLILFGIFFWFIIKVILTAKDAEGAYIASGIFALYMTHIIINVGMNLGVMPVTGLPLPFISYGGSFYITCILSVGILINIYQRRFVH